MENRLIRAYIGNNATRIMNNSINWHAGLLAMFVGPVWFFYRKAWLVGIIYIFIAYALSRFEFFNIESISIILGSITIFCANKLYIWDVKNKVSKIIKENSGINEENLIEIVKEKGGISIGLVIIYSISLFMLLTSIIISYISQYGYVFDRLKSTMELMSK